MSFSSVAGSQRRSRAFRCGAEERVTPSPSNVRPLWNGHGEPPYPARKARHPDIVKSVAPYPARRWRYADRAVPDEIMI